MRRTIALLCAAAVLPASTLKPNPTPDYKGFDKKLPKDRQIVHALDRLTFGPHPGDVEAVKKIGLKKWIDQQLHPDKIKENPDLTRKLEPLETAAPQRPPRRLAPAEYAQQKLYRAIYSNRQLQEVLVDFWYNHFNIDMSKGADRVLVPDYERNAIRPYVLGHFRDLLRATAFSPAMLFYLDNWQSVAPDAEIARRNPKQAARGLNENYARELMELHTLGVDGGYTQKDVTEVARCFTGWTIDQPNQNGPFVFRPAMHDKGAKTVLGVTISAGGGQEDGEKVLDILARHPSTARFISKELAQRFVADDPPPALIDRMTKTFTETDGDLRAVLATMFDSKEFFSEGAYRAKVKSPLEMVVSAVRATSAQVTSTNALFNQIASLGEPLYRKIEPTGYSNANAEWVNSSALLGRMNFAIQLTENKIQGMQVDPNRFSAVPEKAAEQVLFTAPSPETLRAIQETAVNGSSLAALVIGSPEFQRR